MTTTDRLQKEAETARVIMDYLGIRGLLRALLDYGYEHGYHAGDGISSPLRWYAQLNFQGLRMRHPGAALHDPGYAEGLLHPLLPKRLQHDESGARAWFDWRFGDALAAFGCWKFGRATTWPLTLRVAGWVAWNHYRAEERAGRFTHIRNLAVRRSAIIRFQTQTHNED